MTFTSTERPELKLFIGKREAIVERFVQIAAEPGIIYSVNYELKYFVLQTNNLLL